MSKCFWVTVSSSGVIMGERRAPAEQLWASPKYLQGPP